VVDDLFPEALLDLDAQISEVRREIKQRTMAFPRFVANGTKTQAQANRQMALMHAVLKTLEELKAQRAP
jgi:hypothetical protein